MKSTKILALVLALLMVLPLLFAGCAKDDGKKGNVDVVVETKEAEDTSKKYDAKVHDLGGHEFWFLTRSTTHQHLAVNEIYAEELNGDKINDAVFKRNATLEQKYNCKISQELNDDPANAVKEQLLAGEYQYDFIYTGVSSLRRLSASNLLVDFQEIENLDLEKAWWDKNMYEGLSIAGKVYYLNGSAGTMDERSAWAMFFNKDVVEKADLESPFTLAEEGKWTIEKFYEYMMATFEDLDGNGVMEIGKDRFGYLGESLNNWMHVAACHCQISRISEAGDIEIPPTVSKDLLKVWEALKPILTSQYRIVKDSGFSNGGATFYACNSAVIFNIAKNDVNWGILPMPKLNEEQEEYWTSINPGWCYGYAIPVATDNASDAEANGFDSGREQAAYFLEAFAYYSMGTLETAYVEQVVKYQVVKDAKSGEMLEMALKNKVYDPVAIFDFGKIGYNLFREVGSNSTNYNTDGGVGTDVNYDTLVSTYESRVSAARKQLNSYINYITSDD